ncbi:putative dimethyl sulfoxide reductase chain YnfE [invertebrate metagenome]|uniref:Putative dimethyl sulfoxide reductase chain YnfE n=1 Tax=invertebrate metagenome TaxID=1711999 RepID=A0A2H9T5I8_9ZZZZ
MTQLLKKALSAALNRRRFMKWSTAAGGAAVVAGSNLPLKALASDPQLPHQKSSSTDQTSWSACMVNCGSRCPLQVHTKDNVITHVESDHFGDDGYGHHQIRACLRGRSIRQRVYNPDRLKYPMKRVGKRGEGRFERISWDETLDIISEKLKHTITKYGNEAVYYQYGSGTTGYKTDGANACQRFLNMTGGYLGYYGNYSWGQILKAMPYTYGTNKPAAFGSYTSEISNANLLVMFGYNPAETRMSGGGEIQEYMHATTKKRIRTIIIDPRYTDTAAGKEEEWIPIRPGTDAALVEGIAHVLITEHLTDDAFLEKYCVGYDEATLPNSAPKNGHYKAHILGQGSDGTEKTPQWASKITGIPADKIIQLAREIGTAKPAYIVQGTGIQRQANGEQACRAITMLPILTGNIGLPGTNTAEMPANYSFPVKGLPTGSNPVKESISFFKWTDAIIRAHEMTDISDGVMGGTRLKAPIKFIWNYAGNVTINQHADINRTRQILEDESLCEFILVIENHMTPTARFADVLLPDIMTIENYDVASNGYASGSLGAAIPLVPAIKRMYETRSAYEICTGLAKRFDVEEQYTEGRTHEQWVRHLYDQLRQEQPQIPSLDDLRKNGPYKQEAPKKGRIALEDFRQNPGTSPLGTPSGKIEIYSEQLAKIADSWELKKDDVITPLPQYVTTYESHLDPLTKKYPLQLIGFHMKGRVHSTYHNVATLREAVMDAVWMNPIDAQKRGIKDGALLKVWNDRGEVRIRARITPRIIPGTVGIGEGAWYTPDKNGIDRGGCINTLTTQRSTPLSKGNPQHTNLVEVAIA